MDHHQRLGIFRRNRRNYSFHLRKFGKTCADRMDEKELNIFKNLLLKVMILTMNNPKDLEIFEMSMFTYVFAILKLKSIATPYLGMVDIIRRGVITLKSFSEQEIDRMTGFSSDDITRMMTTIDVPDFFSLGVGRHTFHVCKEHAFLYLLTRFHSPSVRQADDSKVWRYDYSVLSRLFNSVVYWFDTSHRHRLRQLNDVAHKYPRFNAAILRTILRECPGLDEAGGMPPDAVNCALFGDGSRFKICKPSGADWRQRATFSGDKWIHCVGVQGIFGPDGMFYDWFDELVGREPDINFMRNSNVNEILRQSQMNEIRQFWAYLDKGYTWNTHLRCAAHGPGALTVMEIHYNWVMSKVREGVEWGFGKLKMRNKLIVLSDMLKIQLFDVSRLVRVAVLLTNAHTCMHQSETGLWFHCYAPTLEEYFN